MSISKSRLVALSVLSCGLFSLSASAAGDLYVSATLGSDASTNPGTDPANPLKTINRAAVLVKAGMTVHVAPGTYLETVKTKVNGTAQARVRYVSDTPFAAKIIGSGTEAMWTASGNYSDIVGFDISGPGRLGINNGGSYVQIIGNHIHDLLVSGGCTGNGGAGIDNSNYQAENDDVIGNIVHDIGTPGACNGVHAIYHAMSGGKIMNNIAYRASSFGIHLWHAAKHAVVMNNTVFDNGSSNMGGGIVIGSGDSGGYDGSDASRIDNVVIANNIVYRNPASSIVEYCYPKMPCIGPNIQVTNNLVNGNGQGIHLLSGTFSNTIDADPMFVNYQVDGTGDLHLKSGSPAIDKGMASGAPSTDLDGRSRPQGGGIDIGAYEYIAPVVSAPAIALSASSLDFGYVAVGNVSAIKVLTIKNSGNAPLSFTSAFSFSSGFSGSGNCSTATPLAPGASCVVNLKFAPTASGKISGSMVIKTNAPNSPNNVTLQGTGMGHVKLPRIPLIRRHSY